MTPARAALGAVLGVVAYVGALLGGAAFVAAVVSATREIPPTGWLTVVPPVLAGVLAPLAGRAGRAARWWAGLLVAVPAALAAAGTTWWGSVLAEQHGGPPAAGRTLDVVGQTVAVLAVAALTVVLLRRRTGPRGASDAD